VDRTSVTQRLTNTPEEEDYPSIAAGANGDIWLAYVQFHHSPDHLQLRVSPHEAPRDFSHYQEPTAGPDLGQKYAAARGENRQLDPPGGIYIELPFRLTRRDVPGFSGLKIMGVTLTSSLALSMPLAP